MRAGQTTIGITAADLAPSKYQFWPTPRSPSWLDTSWAGVLFPYCLCRVLSVVIILHSLAEPTFWCWLISTLILWTSHHTLSAIHHPCYWIFSKGSGRLAYWCLAIRRSHSDSCESCSQITKILLTAAPVLDPDRPTASEPLPPIASWPLLVSFCLPCRDGHTYLLQRSSPLFCYLFKNYRKLKHSFTSSGYWCINPTWI